MNALQRLIQNDDTRCFFESTYQQKWNVHRGNQTNIYQDLFSFEQVEDFLYTARPWDADSPADRNNCAIVRHPEGAKELRSNAGVNDLMLDFAQGYTFVLNNLESRVSVLSDFCSCLSKELGSQIQVNAYCTPPQSKGFDTHYDGHDVFIVQLEGKKDWRVWSEPDVKNPPSDNYFRDWGEIADPRNKQRPAKGTPKGDPVEVTLSAGDTLYIPRGFAHDAQATDSASLHLTFGIVPTQWYEYLNGLIIDAAMRLPELRQAVPDSIANGKPTQIDHELAHKLLDKALKNTDHDEAWRHSHRRNVNSPPKGVLRSIIASQSINENTQLLLRSEAQHLKYSVTAEGRLWVFAGGRKLKMPNRVACYIGWLCEHRPTTFRVNQLPDELPGDSRVAFAKYMIKQGLATIKA